MKTYKLLQFRIPLAPCFVALAALLTTTLTIQAGSATWTNSSASVWLAPNNWSPNGFPGVTNTAPVSNSDVATFSSTAISGNASQINMNSAGGNLNLGAILWNYTTAAGTMGNNATTADGTLRLYGATVNVGATGGTINNLLLGVGDAATQNLTVQNAAGSGTRLMGVQFTNAAGVVYVATNRSLTISASISGSSGFTKSGAGVLSLSGTNNTFSGPITVNAGALALSVSNLTGTVQPANGSASSITMAAGTTLRSGLDGSLVTAPITVNAGASPVTINAPVNSPGAGTNTTFYINSVVSGGANVTFNSSVNQNGLHTVRLNNQNTYSGNTLLDTSGGTTANQIIVRLGTNDALPTTTVVTIDGQAGTGSGRFSEINLNGFNQTLAGLTNVARALRFQRVVNSDASAYATLTISNTSDYTFGASSGANSGGFLGGGANGSVTANGTPGSTHGRNFGLTKSGSGTFTLISASTYEGATTVNGGTLQLSGAGTLGGGSYAGSISIGSGAALVFGGTLAQTLSGTISGSGTLTNSGTGTVTISGTLNAPGVLTGGKMAVTSTQTGTGNVQVNGGTLAVTVSGTSQWSPGTLTLTSGTLDFNSVTNVNTTTAPLVPGGVSVSAITVNVTSIAGGLPVVGDSYPLLGNTAGTTTGYTLTAEPPGVFGHLGVSGNTLVYVVDGISDVWAGTDTTNPTFWDIATSTNWIGKAANNTPALTFANGDSVLFDDSAVAASPVSVSIQAAVTPSAVIFNGSTKDYTVASSSANVIGGSASLTKSGTNTVTLIGSADHTYTGATVINAGTLQLGDGTSGNDATIGSTSGVTNNGTLIYNPFGITTANYNITGSGKLTKQGQGTNILTGNNLLNGVTVTGGTLEFSAGNTTNGGSSGTRNLNALSGGTVTISGTANVTFPGTISFGQANSSPGNLTMSGGTLSVNGFDTANNNRALIIAEFASETSTFTMSGGTLNVPVGRTYVGWAGTGIWNMSGGTANLERLQIGSSVGTSPILNLTGGQMNIGSGGINTNAASLATINLNGGTLSSTTNWSTTASATIGGNVTFAPASGHTITWSGVLSGSTGDLIVSGPGTLTLSGANTYTGNTRIDGGKLVRPVGFSDASAALVLNGPAATNSISITANTKGWTNLAFTAAQAGVLEFNFSVAPGTTVSPLEITGLADFTAPPAVSVIFTSGSAAGTYPLMTWGSTSGNNPALAPLTIIGAPPTSTLSTNNNTLYVTIPVNVKANNTLDLTNAASWTANWVPTSFEAAIWDNTVLGANTTALGADTTWGGIQIKDPGGLVTINAGNTLTLGAASTDINMTNATADLTLNCNVALGAANVWDVTNSRTLTVAGVISSSSTLTKQGAGTVTLTGANTYTNSTTVTAGQLNINNRAATNMGTLNVVGLLAGDLATVGIGGGTLNFTPGRINVGGQGGGVGDGAINQTGGTVTFTGGDMVVIAGGGAANPKGTYNLSGGSIDATGVAGGIANRGVLVGANATGTGVFNLSGTGSLLLGTNIVHVARGDGSPANGSTMSGTFNQTGGTAQMGFLSIGGSSVAANKTTNVQAYVNLNGGTFVATNFVRLANGGGDTNAMLIGGTADVTLPAFPLARGPGSTNTLTLDGGTLRPLAASASYLQAGTFDNAYVTTNGAHLAVASGNDITVGQVLQDAPAQAGELTKSGAGILTLTGTNTYTGTTTISAGTLKLANDAAINLTSGLSIAAGGTLDTVALTGPPPATIPLTASGTGTTVGTTAAAIIGVSGFPHDLSSRPLILNYDGANPAVYLSGGTLNLNNNPFTINGSVLANGVYTIIAQSDAPAITGSVATSTVNGTALTGKFGTVSLSGNTVVLTVSDASAPQPTIAPVTVSGTNLVVSVPTTSGYNYVLQSTTNLTPAITWMNESTNAGTGGNLILNVPIDPDKPQRFLRFWVY